MLFGEELETALALIQDLPSVGEPVPHRRIRGVRRVLLGRTQHHLYYVVREEEAAIEILAFWHTSRGWQPRL